MALGGLRALHARGRLMEGVLWQLNSYVLACLERAGEAAAEPQVQAELRCGPWCGGGSGTRRLGCQRA